MAENAAVDWPRDIYETLQSHGVRQVGHVPDAGHSQLIRSCEADNSMTVVTLTTEEEGIGLMAGAWLGGDRGVVLMQSSGVGNIINALAMPNVCRMPLVMIVSMRGEWGEFVPWQVPMGQATPAVLEAMGVRIMRSEQPGEVREMTDSAFKLAYDTGNAVALLLSQRLIGAKDFRKKKTDG